MLEGIRLRPANLATPGEREFLAKSWVESYASSPTSKLVTHQGLDSEAVRFRWKPSPEYWATWDTIANVLLRRGRVVIAEDTTTTPMLIACFLVWELDDEGTVVHYVYTRLAYRRSGLARRLCAELPGGTVRYTHRARDVRVPSGWRFTLRPLLNVLSEPERKVA